MAVMTDFVIPHRVRLFILVLPEMEKMRYTFDILNEEVRV